MLENKKDKGLRQCVKLQYLCGGDYHCCDWYRGKTKSDPTS